MEFDITKTYEALLVLNYGSEMEMRSERVEIEVDLIDLYIEKQDTEYPDVNLRWNDYYPVLGEKVIILRSAMESLEGETVQCEIHQDTLNELNAINPDLELLTCKPFTTDEKITNGKMRFRLSGETLAPKIEGNTEIRGIDELKLIFFVEKDSIRQEIEAAYYVKNNYNTTLQEVLEGDAVFVYDTTFTGNHKGKTDSRVTEDAEKKVDFIQELLNQVIPRKRSLTDYEFIGEDGYYGNETENRITIFKSNFNLEINTNADNLTDTYKKLIKDYELQGSQTDYLNKIMDKETFVGEVERTERTGSETKDELINGDSGNTVNDTGLYELYTNVVRPFVAAMIEEAEKYAGIRGTQLPTDNWIARTGEGNANSADPHGAGMSYCFGGKDTIQEFNRTVAPCGAPDAETIDGYESDDNPNNHYRGNINEATCAIEPGVTQDWSGLKRDEWRIWRNDGQIVNHRYNPTYWAGIDCSGFVYRAMAQGKSVMGDLVTMSNIYTYDFMDVNAVYWLNVTRAFENSRVLQFDRTLVNKTHKGDFVEYSGHVSIVYSENPSCVTNGNNEITCNYEIIHAYGQPQADVDGDGIADEFTRKVLVTPNQMLLPNGRISLSNPNGFGRIKLWN